ncbi:hypothetical protein Tco_0302730 [Tanacetum coccineum]
MVIKREVLYDFPRFFGVLIVKLAAGGAVNFTFKMKRHMIRENLDLEPKISAMMREFLDLEVLPGGKNYARNYTNLCFDYVQDTSLGYTPSALNKMNFHQNPSEVQPIKLTKYMLDGLEASGAPPMETKGKKKSKTKKSTLVKTTLQLAKKKESSWGRDTSHSVSTDQPTNTQTTKRNIQLVVMGFTSISAKDCIHKSKFLSEGTYGATKEELKGFSDEEILDDGEDMDTDQPDTLEESS